MAAEISTLLYVGAFFGDPVLFVRTPNFTVWKGWMLSAKPTGSARSIMN